MVFPVTSGYLRVAEEELKGENRDVSLDLPGRGRVFGPVIRAFEGGLESVIREIVARSNPEEQNDGGQCDDAGKQEEPYPADIL